MGRVQLVNSIINSMLLYSFHIFSWPISLLKSIDRWIRNFVWAGDIHTKKLVIVAWKKVCLPVKEWGLGLRSIRAIDDAAILKLSWDVMCSNAGWAEFLRARFMKLKQPVSSYVKSSIWYGIRRFMNIVRSNTTWIIGDATQINFWKDRWMRKPVADVLCSKFPSVMNDVQQVSLPLIEE